MGYEVGCFKTKETTDAEFSAAFKICGGKRIPNETVFEIRGDKHKGIAKWYENKHKVLYPNSTVDFQARAEQ